MQEKGEEDHMIFSEPLKTRRGEKSFQNVIKY